MDGKDQAAALYGQETANETISTDEARDLFGQDRSEDELHRACVQWADVQSAALPELKALFHPPNGGARSAAAGARMKAMGARAGIPDLCLPIVRPVTWTNGDEVPAGALWVELKSAEGRLRDTQRTWRARLLKHQHCWTLCRRLEDFRVAVTDYISGDYRQESF
ncbi:hypothetical protein BSZ35_19025 [Salinibacter sp. 10B]|uniref:VRR-NUC domain-containing protein n=1 Tax=Salinibacter sp. 10B TaxID=1923971 RepID=UPI000D2B350C|nr:VRR-NUC domain-containing protein [Salinibacter sp. 10B]PQJ26743.1 hypothetical protein BSZ35_19025 [Salinibacter sp. 10B]